MATNPKLPPDEQKLRDDHAHVVMTREKTSPWPLIVTIIAVIILIALIAWVILSRPRRSSATSNPAATLHSQMAMSFAEAPLSGKRNHS